MIRWRICILLIIILLQKVLKDYQGWSKDYSTSFTILFSSSTIIQLDLEEQTIDPWKILPLVSPAQVS